MTTEENKKFKTIHIPYTLHTQQRQEIIDSGLDINLRDIVRIKLERPLSKQDIADLKK
jgi:hypothetical protein